MEQISIFVDTIDVDLFHKLWNSVEQCGTDLLKFAQKRQLSKNNKIVMEMYFL